MRTMNKSLYFRLAAGNIRKNAKSYVPFIITSVITAAMFFIISSLALNEDLAKLKGADSVQVVLGLGTWITAIFAVIFLFYTNSFLMKRRKKEIGLWNILGMEKKHIAKVILIETAYVYAITAVGGLLFGLLLDKLMILLVAKMINAGAIPEFYFSGIALRNMAILFAAIFLLIYLDSLRQITFSKPIELLHGGSVGEKEPKAKWILAILGVGCLGTGYYLAVSITNPIEALNAFFVAVILVIVGTYLIFTAGSIAVLKLLKKNKRFYYKTKHFISVSGMMYRMKQNAVGLGNICILSTMVLVMISSTSSLVIGVDDIVQQRFPYDFQVYSFSSDDDTDLDAVEKKLVKSIKENDSTANNFNVYKFLSVTALKNSSGEYLFKNYQDAALSDVKDLCQLYFVTLDDYSRTHSGLALNDGEVYVYQKKGSFDADSITINDKKYAVKGELEDFTPFGESVEDGTSYLYIMLNDFDTLESIYEQQKSVYTNSYSIMTDFIGFDSELSDSEQLELSTKLYEDVLSGGYIRCKSDMASDFTAIYGGLFFIGIFLGLLFTIAAILIIYYKQISEGYDDKQRFDIMQKVGMTHQEVKSTIHSQILTVFFLPLITSGVHVAFALPMITKILKLMGLTNDTLYFTCTLVSFGAFAAIYAAVYGLTAKVYYKIVKR